MDKDGFLEIGSKSSAPDSADGARAKLFAGKNKPSFSKAVIERLQQELGGLCSSGNQKPTCFPNQPLGESLFRFLLANEEKRSDRSGHSFHVLLTYFAEADGRPTQIGGQVMNTLVPILSNMLRETDYLGWYRENQVLGGVLTGLREHPVDGVSSRIEQRFWWRMGREFLVEDFARLRVRLLHVQEFSRLESGDVLFKVS
jgi:hypothetical protein